MIYDCLPPMLLLPIAAPFPSIFSTDKFTFNNDLSMMQYWPVNLLTGLYSILTSPHLMLTRPYSIMTSPHSILTVPIHIQYWPLHIQYRPVHLYWPLHIQHWPVYIQYWPLYIQYWPIYIQYWPLHIYVALNNSWIWHTLYDWFCVFKSPIMKQCSNYGHHIGEKFTHYILQHVCKMINL